MQKLFSGVQPSGNLHIGNYLGAIKPWVWLQDEYEATFAVMDLHAITVPQDPETLRKKTIEIAKIYLAAGIDREKCTLFVQSHVSAHSELAWILNTITRMGDLDKMTQYKDKSQKEGETTSIGLYDYPVLMAADILLYDTAIVPVGEDQKQHVELARTLARRFNERFGETFVIPEARVYSGGGRIMGLDDPTKKMSKSASSEYNYISLMDDADTIRRKIKKAVTENEVTYSQESPAMSNLLNIYSFFSGESLAEIQKKFAGKGYGDFKTDLAEVILRDILPFQETFKSISDDEVQAILQAGAVKARTQADAKMKQVRERVGLL